ncbi:DUF748 domain-containing protein [Geotalea toluenoxydans]|uniref:DUF748 domain-containing protein n=1 Tax=Geotalea toluenoxydans TaxID=421624 RepID=UPI0006D21465|nr:DUF748 domain-containing protein [Geotalea toluenoxydans]
MTGLATRGEDAADYEISFSTARGEHLELAGDLALEPMEGSVSLNVSGVPLEAYHPYLADRLTSPVSGRAELNAEAPGRRRTGSLSTIWGLSCWILLSGSAKVMAPASERQCWRGGSWT